MAKVKIVDNWKSLKTLPRVEETETWKPVSHYKIVDILESEAKQIGLPIINRRIELNQANQQMFGNYTLSDGENSQFSIGFRNSTNKSLAIGFCAGLNIVVCSNLQFSGEWLAFRKHSGNLTLEEVKELTRHSFEFLPSMKKEFDQRIKRYSRIKLKEETFKATIFDMMQQNVIPSAKFRQFLSALEAEKEIKKTQTLGLIYNSTTRLYSKQSIRSISEATPKLLDYCDQYYEKAAA